VWTVEAFGTGVVPSASMAGVRAVARPADDPGAHVQGVVELQLAAVDRLPGASDIGELGAEGGVVGGVEPRNFGGVGPAPGQLRAAVGVQVEGLVALRALAVVEPDQRRLAAPVVAVTPGASLDLRPDRGGVVRGAGVAGRAELVARPPGRVGSRGEQGAAVDRLEGDVAGVALPA